jgi:two-component system sensor histidine kinase QseC
LLPVYREINELLGRVEQTIERERSFAGAAAHELRTPLAELRATAEVAIRWPESGAASSALHEILAIGREMERLVEFLLLLSRGSAGGATPDGAEAPIDEVLRGALEQARGVIEQKRLNVTLDVATDQKAPVTRDALEVIVRNLVENAVHYTPEGGAILVRAERGDNGFAGLLVENGPVHLSEGDLTRLFEPFWRMDGARADRTHAGLGLAVVQRIANSSGLRITPRLCGDRLQMQITSAAGLLRGCETVGAT